MFPGYEFQGLIACGGMGAVYAAVQRSLDREVAFKVLPREFGNDAAFRAGFETEAKAMARLNHPNLIGVYDFGNADGMLYIVMEYVPGQSLFHSAHGVAIDPGEVVRLITGICHGLAHAHKHGIIHRDIKPANILLDLQAEPKIGDFGLARPVENKAAEGEEIFGTPHYTAPEVVHSPYQVDHRADIFSVGVMLHELLTGRLPADDPRSPSAIAHCDPRFDNVVRRATDPNPENRYTSADDIIADLQKIATTPGPRILQTAVRTHPRANRALPPGQRPGPRRPIKVKTSSSSPALVTFIILLLIGAGVVVLLNKQSPRPTAEEKPGITDPIDQLPAATEPPPKPAPKPTRDETASDTPIAPPAIGIADTTEPEPTPDKPEPVTPAAPIFDVDGFLLKARTIMAEKAKQALDTRDKALSDSFTSFENTLERETRSLVARERDLARDNIRGVFRDWKDDGIRIPDELPEELETIRRASEFHREYRSRQITAAKDFREAIAKLDADYQRGIQLQIDRLDETEDPQAVKLLKAEIARARDDSGYFPKLVLPDEDFDDEEDD